MLYLFKYISNEYSLNFLFVFLEHFLNVHKKTRSENYVSFLGNCQYVAIKVLKLLYIIKKKKKLNYKYYNTNP